MRLAAAIAVVAVAWSAAVYVHQRVIYSPPTPICAGSPFSCARQHPSWEDPAAVLIALGGLAVAVGIFTYRRNFAKPS